MDASEPIPTCLCKCHFGGAVSCPTCKDNHYEKLSCKHCNNE